MRLNSGHPILIPIKSFSQCGIRAAALSSRAAAGQVPRPAYAKVAQSGRGAWSNAGTALPEPGSGHGASRITTGLASITLRPSGSEITQIRESPGSVKLARSQPCYAISVG